MLPIDFVNSKEFAGSGDCLCDKSLSGGKDSVAVDLAEEAGCVGGKGLDPAFWLAAGTSVHPKGARPEDLEFSCDFLGKVVLGPEGPSAPG
jgi:hypothetical protein